MTVFGLSAYVATGYRKVLLHLQLAKSLRRNELREAPPLSLIDARLRSGSPLSDTEIVLANF